jgi:ribonuclease HI
MITIYCDGASRGNGGASAVSFIIFDRDDIEIMRDSKYIGEVTNNVAEYAAVLFALEWCEDWDIEFDIRVNSDSMLVMKQLSGEWKTNDTNLRALKNVIKDMTSKFKSVKYEWHPRTHPMLKLCDKMNNETLDEMSEMLSE